jgi:hypothetical protein
MIIAFGLTMFLIIFQFLNPLFLIFLPQNTDIKTDADYINSDLENFEISVSEFDNNNKGDYISNFTYPGKISVIIDKYSEDTTTLLFRFSRNNINYKEIQIPPDFGIEIQNIFIKQYCIRFLNNSKFIIFI